MVGLGRLPVLCVLGMLVFSSSTGWASTASLDGDSILRYIAAPGEANALVVTEEGLAVRLSDSGASITAGPGCVSQGADVLCDFSSFSDLLLIGRLADRNDSADFSGLDFPPAVNGTIDVSGGPGDDRLTGGPALDHFRGLEGNDVLVVGAGSGGFQLGFGGPGNDTIRGGPTHDLLKGGAGNDTVVGGAGVDNMYARAKNLRLTPTRLVGEGSDRLNGIEEALLIGTSGRNVIDARTWRARTGIETIGGNDLILGGSKRDVVFAGNGNDTIVGGQGRDWLVGDAGDDVLFSRDNWRDHVEGGFEGFDRARVDRRDRTFSIEVFLP